MTNIRNLTIEELKIAISSIGEDSYRANQLYEWLHKKMIFDIADASNISNSLKEKLKLHYDLSFPKILKEYISKLDDTRKYLIELSDGSIIESVLMKYKYGYSICISSEVGCNMGCKFCASTIGGMKRNLDIYELLSQVYLISKKNDINISNIVIMGTGEPLLNIDNVITFLKIINSKEGQNISLRNITISTCGIVPGIRKLIECKFPLTLALSLHAPNQSIRERIMPIAKKYNINEVMDAMADYYIATGRRITFEYSLISKINDSIGNAQELVLLFNNSFKNRHIDFNVNLIPVNEVVESGYKRPDHNRIDAYKNYLLRNGINVTIRRELGRDISGSCGQLRFRAE